MNTDQSVVRLSVSNPKSTRAILYFGGNAEDVSLSLPEYARMISGVAIYMVHYRGYGGSTGSPSEASLRHDALAIYWHLKDKHSDILVMGRSLGTSLAIGVAAQFEPKGLLLITPFDSIQAIAQRVAPFLPIRLLLSDPYRSIDLVSDIQCPTLVLAASDDEIIPKENTLRLVKKFPPEIATLQVIPETDHNSISSSTLYWSSTCRFIENVFVTP
ncbi:MAG: alpha/beta hydrolase [Pirellulales bacterium]|nr:alpha/beta hydrolase [Pirellulales bacterium]MBL7181760.1 alpha/beta hydrolase [Pirellulales bacterium]